MKFIKKTITTLALVCFLLAGCSTVKTKSNSKPEESSANYEKHEIQGMDYFYSAINIGLLAVALSFLSKTKD